MKKWTVVILIVCGAGAGMWLCMRKNASEVQSVPGKQETVQVSRGTVGKTVSTSGYVVANREVEIKCKASGEIVSLPFDISDAVKKSDLLLELDPRDEEFNVQERKSSLKAAMARLEQAKINLAMTEKSLAADRKKAEALLRTAKAAADDAASKAKRAYNLWQKKIGSREEHETASTASVRASAELESAQVRMEELDVLELEVRLKKHDVTLRKEDVESARIALQQAEDRLAETKIRSPMNGVVAALNVQKGQIIASAISNVGGGTAVMALIDPSRMYVYASVDESDIGSILKGQTARITVDAHPDTRFRGKVVRIGAKGKNVSNVITYEVRIEVTGGDISLLKPEMSADIEIIIAHRPDVLVVPVQAVFRRRGEAFVFVASEGNTPKLHPVTAGVQDDEYAEITEGLSEGDTVVANVQQVSGKWKKEGSSRRDRRRPPGFMPGMRRRR